MQSIEVTHLVQAYRMHEMRRRAEEERRIRHVLAVSKVPTQRTRRLTLWLHSVRSFISQRTTDSTVIRGDAAAHSKRGAA